MSDLMTQYATAKAKYPKHILLFKVGDFYEAFNEDAQKMSKALTLCLTNRSKKGETPVPMCGIMAHSAEKYIAQLLRGGFSVATAEYKHEEA